MTSYVLLGALVGFTVGLALGMLFAFLLIKE